MVSVLNVVLDADDDLPVIDTFRVDLFSYLLHPEGYSGLTEC